MDIFDPQGEALQQVLMQAQAAKQRRKIAEANREKQAREAPVTVTKESYDAVIGEWLMRTPDGGTLRTRLNTNGAPIGRMALNRVATAQTSEVNNKPSETDMAWLLTEMEVLSQQMINLMGPQLAEGDPNAEDTPGVPNAIARYRNDTYYDLTSGTFFRFDLDESGAPPDPKWVPQFQLFQGFTGDPNDQGGTPISIYIEGAIAVNDEGLLWVGETTTPQWNPLPSGVLSLTTDPTTAGTPVQDNLLVIDKSTGDQYYADDSSPQVWVKQPTGGGGGTACYLETDYAEASIAHNTFTLIDWASFGFSDPYAEVRDDANFYDAAGNSDRLSISAAGLLKIKLYATVQVVGGTGNLTHWAARLRVLNSSGFEQSVHFYQMTFIGGIVEPTGRNFVSQEFTFTFQADAGDYVEISVTQTNSFSIALNFGDGFNSSVLIEKV